MNDLNSIAKSLKSFTFVPTQFLPLAQMAVERRERELKSECIRQSLSQYERWLESLPDCIAQAINNFGPSAQDICDVMDEIL